MAGDQKGADMKVVEEAIRRMELVFVELDPGDALFFHGNLLHRSDKNNSDFPRWSMITAFNRMDNQPYTEHDPSCYTPVEMVSDENILSYGAKSISESSHFNQ
jgi:ectoine hydroxylase-related dioxygenase (phytanoyl-CoA dioxygenase family)